MEFLKTVFSPGWVGSFIGVIGLVVGYIFYRASRIGPRPVYELRALRLIEKEKRALPEEVEILYRGKGVQRLTMTHAILWNSGKATLGGENIIVDDPLRLEFSEGTQVLRARVLRVTCGSNKFKARINPNSPNEVICTFGYLDAGDGAVMELLHTDEEPYPKVKGTIRGVPKGLLNWGRSSPRRKFPSFFKNYKFATVFALLLGVFMTFVGFSFLGTISASQISTLNYIIAWIFAISGLFYIFASLVMLLFIRRRFPRSLMIENIEE